MVKYDPFKITAILVTALYLLFILHLFLTRHSASNLLHQQHNHSQLKHIFNIYNTNMQSRNLNQWDFTVCGFRQCNKKCDCLSKCLHAQRWLWKTHLIVLLHYIWFWHSVNVQMFSFHWVYCRLLRPSHQNDTTVQLSRNHFLSPAFPWYLSSESLLSVQHSGCSGELKLSYDSALGCWIGV